jgi:predicted phosphodiesterase
MRYAVIADLHANWEALIAVLRKIDKLQVDKIVCLGDLVGLYADPNACVAEIRRRGVVSIAGNHDRAATKIEEPDKFSPIARQVIYWTREQLNKETKAFLSNLPTSQVHDNLLLFHGALHPVPNENMRLNSLEAAQQSFEVLRRDYPSVTTCFFGHLHLPLVYEWNNGNVRLQTGKKIKLSSDSRYLINPGSVGHPRDGDPRASFALYDTEESTIQFHRVSFDVGLCRKKLKRESIPYYHPLNFIPSTTNRAGRAIFLLNYFLVLRLRYLLGFR